MLLSTYDEAAFSEKTCREWFQRFKNGDFDVDDRHDGGKEKIFEDSEWEVLLAEHFMPNARRIGRIIGSDSTSHFETPQKPWE